MDAATLGVLIGGFTIGAGFYWAWTPATPLGDMKPYLGHESFRRMRAWVWIKFLVMFLPLAIYFPEVDPDYPLAQKAWAALLGGFASFHARFLATSEARWDKRAGVRPFPTNRG